MRLGAHESIAGGLYKAFDRAQSVGCEAVQIFVKPNRQWAAKPLTEEDVAQFKAKAARLLDLYARTWGQTPLGDDEFVVSGGEKPSMQARNRRQKTLPAIPGSPMKVEHEHKRCGAWGHLPAMDVRRAKLFGRCEGTTGIGPFDRLVDQAVLPVELDHGQQGPLFQGIDLEAAEPLRAGPLPRAAAALTPPTGELGCDMMKPRKSEKRHLFIPLRWGSGFPEGNCPSGRGPPSTDRWTTAVPRSHWPGPLPRRPRPAPHWGAAKTRIRGW